MAWLPDGEKISKIPYICFGATHELDRQTDGHRMLTYIYRAYAYASRCKNYTCKVNLVEKLQI